MHNNAHHLPPIGAAAAAGSVTTIVPARNEEAVIAACNVSLASQPEIGEILVVNDQSTDGTAGVVTNSCPVHADVCEGRHEVRTGRGEKGLYLGRTRSGTRQARWPESHGQGNSEGRHAFR